MIFGIDILPWFESFIANTRAAPFAGLLFVVLYAAITCILTSPAFLPVPVRQAAPSRFERATLFGIESVSLSRI